MITIEKKEKLTVGHPRVNEYHLLGVSDFFKFNQNEFLSIPIPTSSKLMLKAVC
jgi:hypothetical protein